jgi:hypothetical protein
LREGGGRRERGREGGRAEEGREEGGGREGKPKAHILETTI